MTASSPKISGINLVGIKGRYSRQIFSLPAQSASIGRESDNDLVLTGSSLSRRHVRIEPDASRSGTWVLTDFTSANGTWLNGDRVQDSVDLRHGDRLRLAEEDFLFIDADNHKFDTRGYRIAEKETVVLGKLLFDRGSGPEELLLEEPTVTIGREPTNDVVLDLPGVSGNHCKIRTVDETFTLVDLQSTNGTYLASSKGDGGEQESSVESHQLAAGDEFLVGACRFRFATEKITRAKATDSALPVFMQGPSFMDLVLPVAAAFLVLLTLFFAGLILLRPDTRSMHTPTPPAAARPGGGG